MTALAIDGRTIAYSDGGAGPAVVLVHGLLMDRSMWEPLAEGLRGSHRVVTIDAPGHGESSPATLGYTLDDLTADCLAVCDSIGVDRAVFGGQSLGGFVAMRIALAHPERVRGLMLMDTTSGPENPDALPQYEAFLQIALDEGVSEDLAGVLLLILFGATFATTPDADPWRKKWMEGNAHDFHAVARAVFDRPDVGGLIGAIGAPALVVHGEEDIAIPMEDAERLAAALSGTLVRIPGAGHASPLERPDAVLPGVTAFLDSLP